jgi:hypothetical protein
MVVAAVVVGTVMPAVGVTNVVGYRAVEGAEVAGGFVAAAVVDDAGGTPTRTAGPPPLGTTASSAAGT